MVDRLTLETLSLCENDLGGKRKWCSFFELYTVHYTVYMLSTLLGVLTLYKTVV
jgi:hypothetical protein